MRTLLPVLTVVAAIIRALVRGSGLAQRALGLRQSAARRGRV